MAFSIGDSLSLQGFTIVIGATLGDAAVVIFSTTRTITRIALQIMSTINLSIWPELSRSVGGGHLSEARAILRRSVQLSVAAALLMVFVLALVGAAFIRWWTHGLVDPPVALLLILLSVVLAHSTWYTISTVLLATNNHRRAAVLYLFGTVASLVAAVPLGSALGLAGAASALLAIDVLMVAYVFPAALRVVQDAPVAFIRALFDVHAAVRSASSRVGGAK